MTHMKKMLVLVAALVMVLGAFAPANAKTITAKYKEIKASIDLDLQDSENAVPDFESYKKYLGTANIGNGLEMPIKTKEDYRKYLATVTAKAKLANDKKVSEKMTAAENKKAIKDTKKEARAKAKKKYEYLFGFDSVAMGLPSGSSGSTKTYMDYKAVTSKGSDQYALLNSKKAKTDKETRIRTYDGYYCVAMGSYYGKEIGTKYYVTLSTGRTIRVVMADQKQDKHTNSTHQYAKKNKDILEFVVDDINISSGDISAIPGFEGSIVSIRKITDSRAYED